MFRERSIQSSLSLKDKVLSIDYILVISIFILGLVSILAMYSTDGGNLSIIPKVIFFDFLFSLGCFYLYLLFKLDWHSQSYLIYIVFFVVARSKIFGINFFRFKKMA